MPLLFVTLYFSALCLKSFFRLPLYTPFILFPVMWVSVFPSMSRVHSGMAISLTSSFPEALTEPGDFSLPLPLCLEFSSFLESSRSGSSELGFPLLWGLIMNWAPRFHPPGAWDTAPLATLQDWSWGYGWYHTRSRPWERGPGPPAPGFALVFMASSTEAILLPQHSEFKDLDLRDWTSFTPPLSCRVPRGKWSSRVCIKTAI